MRIAFDATYSIGRNLSGVGVYSQEILKGIPAAHPGPVYLFCYRPHRLLRALREPAPGGIRRRLLWRDWPLRADLFHALNQRVDSTRYRRVVTTFHDLFVLTGEYSTPEFRQRFAGQARLAAERSDLIITVSQFTADQVVNLLGVERSRVRVIHHGMRVGSRQKTGRMPMILFVGALQARKNVLRLVSAFEQTPPGWKLVLVGSAGYGADGILHAIEQSPRGADIEIPGYVSSETLEDLYSKASIFAFPSLDEGFGMPVLDAMARGVPVLTSNRSALREVAGEAALLVDPGSVESIGAGLCRLIVDEDLRSELVRKGFEQSAKFSWETAVEKTWQVYRELL